jgi:hypothetical protein
MFVVPTHFGEMGPMGRMGGMALDPVFGLSFAFSFRNFSSICSHQIALIHFDWV